MAEEKINLPELLQMAASAGAQEAVQQIKNVEKEERDPKKLVVLDSLQNAYDAWVEMHGGAGGSTAPGLDAGDFASMGLFTDFTKEGAIVPGKGMGTLEEVFKYSDVRGLVGLFARPIATAVDAFAGSGRNGEDNAKNIIKSIKDAAKEQDAQAGGFQGYISRRLINIKDPKKPWEDLSREELKEALRELSKRTHEVSYIASGEPVDHLKNLREGLGSLLFAYVNSADRREKEALGRKIMDMNRVLRNYEAASAAGLDFPPQYPTACAGAGVGSGQYRGGEDGAGVGSVATDVMKGLTKSVKGLAEYASVLGGEVEALKQVYGEHNARILALSLERGQSRRENGEHWSYQ